MDSNPWSLLYLVTPLNLCGLRKKYIYVYLEEGRPFLFALLCRSQVCRYIRFHLRNPDLVDQNEQDQGSSPSNDLQYPLLLTWINFNPSMDEYSHPL